MLPVCLVEVGGFKDRREPVDERALPVRHVRHVRVAALA
jgi:hypothetical protein